MAAGHRRHHQLPLLLAWALAACPPLLGQRAGGPSSSPLPGCILHEALLARIKKDLEPWQKLGGIGKELIREGSTGELQEMLLAHAVCMHRPSVTLPRPRHMQPAGGFSDHAACSLTGRFDASMN